MMVKNCLNLVKINDHLDFVPNVNLPSFFHHTTLLVCSWRDDMQSHWQRGCEKSLHWLSVQLQSNNKQVTHIYYENCLKTISAYFHLKCLNFNDLKKKPSWIFFSFWDFQGMGTKGQNFKGQVLRRLGCYVFADYRFL